MAASKKSKNKKKVTSSPSNWEAKKPVLQFAGGFIVLVLLLFLLTSSSFFDGIKTPLLHIYSTIGAGVLNIFGYGVKAQGELLSSSQFSVSIEEGCDAIAPAILFAASILVFPAKKEFKIKGIVFGLVAIFLLNVIRVVSLFMTGVHAPSLFELMHVEVWQTFFVVFTLGLWLFWLRWSTNTTGHAKG